MSIMFILRIILVVLLCIPIWEMFRFLYKKLIREYNDIRVDKSREQRSYYEKYKEIRFKLKAQ